MTQGIYEMHQGKIHPSLLSPRTLEKVRKRISAHAKEHELQEVLDFAHEIFATPMSYSLGTKGWIITLHIPLVKDKTVMVRKLYQLDTAIMRQDHEVVEYSPQKNYISLCPDALRHAIHDESDLRRCQKIGHQYFCKEDAVLYKKASSCVAALYMQESVAAARLCAAHTIHHSSPVLRLDHESIEIRTNEVTTLTCGDKEPSYVPTGARALVDFRPGCLLSNADLEIHAREKTDEEKIYVEHEIFVPEMRIKGKKLDTLVGRAFELNIEHEEAATKLQNTFKKLEEEVNDETVGLLANLSTTHTWVIAVSGTFALLLILTGAFLLKCCLVKRRAQRVPPDDPATETLQPEGAVRPRFPKRVTIVTAGEDTSSTPVNRGRSLFRHRRPPGGGYRGCCSRSSTPAAASADAAATADPELSTIHNGERVLTDSSQIITQETPPNLQKAGNDDAVLRHAYSPFVRGTGHL
jgi:hypothetical protein